MARRSSPRVRTAAWSSASLHDDVLGQNARAGAATTIGTNREEQQDAVVLGRTIFGVFDGHGPIGGARCSKELARGLEEFVVRHANVNANAASANGSEPTREAVERAFMEFDEHLARMPPPSSTMDCAASAAVSPRDGSSSSSSSNSTGSSPPNPSNNLPQRKHKNRASREEATIKSGTCFDRSGACACVAVLGRQHLALAVVGDCGGIVFRPDGQVAFQTPKHTLHDNDHEHDRVMRAGGFIDGGRVNGSLIPTRAFGDFHFKTGENGAPLVTARPDVTVLDREQCAAVVLYSDGVSDALSPADVWAAIVNAACEAGFAVAGGQQGSAPTAVADRRGGGGASANQEEKHDAAEEEEEGAGGVGKDSEKTGAGGSSLIKGLASAAANVAAAASSTVAGSATSKLSIEARLSRAVVTEAIRMGSTDNISCVVLFPNGPHVMRFGNPCESLGHVVEVARDLDAVGEASASPRERELKEGGQL